ncbi:MAG: ROK family transcriptional regulator [Actinomycetaceae bacterium]|nr:ROK family transcriptional regulator [Actinomycetaceae bacterium]
MAESARTSALTQLRHDNREHVVRLLTELGPLTQSQLAKESGLSKATVSNLVKEMTAEEVVTVENTVHNGRRANLITLVPTRRVSLGIDISEHHYVLALVSSDRTELEIRKVGIEIPWDSKKFLESLSENTTDMLRGAKRKLKDLAAIGVGVPAPVEADSESVALTPMLPTWLDAEAVLPGIKELTAGPVTLSNDANLAALAEVAFGNHRGAENLIYVLISRGIGAGMYLRGDEYTGALGFAGEIGHIRSTSGYELCRCGNRGCLEGEIATVTMIKQAQAAGFRGETIEDVACAIHAGHVAVQRVVSDAGTVLGRALADLSSILNPDIMVIGGNPAVTSEVFLEATRIALRRHCLPLVADRIDVFPDSLAGKAVALGAAERALRKLGL